MLIHIILIIFRVTLNYSHVQNDVYPAIIRINPSFLKKDTYMFKTHGMDTITKKINTPI
jgi:hypothetical protein